MRLTITLLAVLFFIPTTAASDIDRIPAMTQKNGYVEPFQIFDNVYYVGDQWVSAYIIKTNKGLILIDTLEFPYGKWIPKNLEKLNLNAQDIKYILGPVNTNRIITASPLFSSSKA